MGMQAKMACSVILQFDVMSELMFPSLTASVTVSKRESRYGDVGQDGLFILQFDVMPELPSLTGSATGSKLES